MCEPGMGALKIAFVMRSNRLQMLNKYEQGLIASDFLYGFPMVQNAYPSAEIIELHSAVESWIDKAFERVERTLSHFFLFRIRLYRLLRMRKRLNKQQVLITNIDSIGMSIALLRVFGVLTCQQVHISQGLTNALEREGFSAIMLVRKCLSQFLTTLPEQFILLGKGAQESIISHGLRHPGKCRVIQFGVDDDFWKGAQAEGAENAYILSVGSDAGRDYQTLLQCHFELPLKIVTRQKVAPGTNTELLSDLDDKALRELYQKAFCVVIPLHDIPQPSGQSATLQAMHCGAPVVITRTKGFWNPEHFCDREHLLFVEPSNPKDLEESVHLLMKNNSFRQHITNHAELLVSEHYTSKNFGDSLVHCIRELESSLLSI
jgi:glycosyltransferase involved in cell wall biosynthesis